jgi:hypothetical protein
MKLHNITFDYTQGPEEFSGDSQYTIKTPVLQRVLQYWLDNGSESFVLDELQEFLEYSEGEEETTFSSADVFICVCDTLIREFEKENFTIECHYSNIIWLFHDISHSCYDADHSEISIDGVSEERAIKDSIDCLAANKILIPFHILEKTEKEFAERFEFNSKFVEYASQYSTEVPEVINLSMFE